MKNDKSFLSASLTQNDYEEAALAAEWFDLTNTIEMRTLRPGSKHQRQDASAAELKRLTDIEFMLGYSPKNGRAHRSRGRVRDSVFPSTLPPVGTELHSCLGDKYIVKGYFGLARDSKPTHVLYVDARGFYVGRAIANLLCGHLASGTAIVTWDGDERGVKRSEMIVPLNKRKVLTKRELMNDEHADPDKKPMTMEEKIRRYGKVAAARIK